MTRIKQLANDEGTTDARMYIMKCARLWPPWTEWDPMWESVCVASKAHADIVQQAWRLKGQQTSGQASQPSSG